MIESAVIQIALIVGVVSVFAYLLHRMHVKKSRDKRVSYWVETASLHVSVPITVEERIGGALAITLHEIHMEIWPKLAALYGIPEPRRRIGMVRLVEQEVAPDHPHVVWYTSSNAIRLRVQPGMMWWYAMELHNAFRATAFGYVNIYPKTEELPKYNEIQRYIKDTYQNV